jgi:4,5-DOPA dioxygenase extradiol
MNGVRLPAVFFAHGSPMNAVERNGYTDAWRALAAGIPRPRAFLAISAHWYVDGTAVTTSEHPATIHDFGGFPRALYEIAYPAPGDAELVRRVRELLAPVPVHGDERWGLDHGVWSVLVHAYPDASIPVVALSIDRTQPNAFHYELGQRLAPLRDEGVLIAASGNIVHNLRAFALAAREPREPHAWARAFDAYVRDALLAGNGGALVAYERAGRDAELAVPTPEHYLPLLYVAGARDDGEPVTFPTEGLEGGGAISMRSVRIG